MSVGENIKRLRREKNITQQQLAECLGISSRAVSQWECGRTAPDISQIPALCHVFGVTSDTLLDIDIEKNEETIRVILHEAEEVGNQGNFEKRTEILREANRRFPRSYLVMHRLADALVNEYCRKRIKDYSEVIALCKRILDECTDSTLRYEAIDTLATAYGYAGKTEEMRALAAEMPRVHFSYEDFMMYRWKGDSEFRERQGYTAYLLNHLLESIGPLSGHCHDDGAFVYSLEERIHLWEMQAALLEQFFPDGDYQYAAQYGESACHLLASTYLSRNDTENAWRWLEKYADFAIHMDTYGFETPHTSPILRGWADGGWIPEGGKGQCDDLIEWLEGDSKTAVLRGDPRYSALIDRLKKAKG